MAQISNRWKGVERWVCVPFHVSQTSFPAFNWFLVQKFKTKPVMYHPWGNQDEVDVHHRLFQTRFFVLFCFTLDHPALTYIFTLTTATFLQGVWNPVDNLQLKVPYGFYYRQWNYDKAALFFNMTNYDHWTSVPVWVPFEANKKEENIGFFCTDEKQTDTMNTCLLKRSFQTFPGERLCICLKFLFAENDLKAWCE